MIDLSDLTLVIPFGYDTEDRLNNLRFLVKYYKKNFIDAKFVIIEGGPNQTGNEFQGQHNVEYRYVKKDDFFHKTRFLNEGVELVNTKYFCAHDTDAFFKRNDIQRTMELLRSGVNFILPFNGIFLDIFGKAKEIALETLDAEFLPMVPHLIPRGNTVHGDGVRCVVNNSVGGAVYYNKQRFLEIGGYNENFKSWGYEDNEMAHRIQVMEGLHKLDNSNCYHMTHRRGKDSQMEHTFTNNNKQEFAKIQSMDKPTMEQYIKEVLIK